MITDLLRCPECSTHYQRSRTRDSIANGPDELEIRIDRLSDIDAAAALAEIDAWILKYARPG
jgi:hypothetical protein